MTGDGELRRELGLLDSVLFSVGGMVGSAIFFFPGATGRQVGAAAVAAWFGVGLLMLVVGTLYAELAMAFPQAGGPAVYPNETLGPWRPLRHFASYLEGICYAFGWTFAITISALALATYLSIMFPAVGAYMVPIAVVAIGLSLGVNLVGVQLTSRTNLLLAAFLLAALLVFVAAGLANAQPANLRVGGELRGGAFFAAMGLAMTGYGAWTAIPSAVEEIRDPERTVPRAILISIGVTTLLYTGVLAALHGVVAPGRFAEGSQVLQAPLGVAAAEMGLPLFGRYVLPAAAVMAIFTTMLVGTMSASRVVLAMGRSGVLPSAFARVHDRFDVPWVALVVLSAAATGLALVPRYFYALEIVAALVGTALPYAINLLAFLGLRYYRTDLTPAFRAPAGVPLAVVAFGVVALAVVGLGTEEVLWSLGALALVSASFLVRYARHREAFRSLADEPG